MFAALCDSIPIICTINTRVQNIATPYLADFIVNQFFAFTYILYTIRMVRAYLSDYYYAGIPCSLHFLHYIYSLIVILG